jgi:hypothetical protein
MVNYRIWNIIIDISKNSDTLHDTRLSKTATRDRKFACKLDTNLLKPNSKSMNFMFRII